MNIGIIGLGKMGMAISQRLLEAHFTVFGYDCNEVARQALTQHGGHAVDSLSKLANQVSTIWIMVPHSVVDTVLDDIKDHLQKNTIIIDGGNSKFSDSVRRAKDLKQRQASFLDCGTSGGIRGREFGFSLMIGGDESAYRSVGPVFKAIATPRSYGLVGPSGAGHYVKMVHNGIEYALLQSYAEGFHLIKKGHYSSLDLEQITGIWQNSAVIRSYILNLAHDMFKNDQNFEKIRGEVAEGGTGSWTVKEAKKQNIPVSTIENALNIRRESKKTGGNYATKIVALLRRQFGGHAVVSDS